VPLRLRVFASVFAFFGSGSFGLGFFQFLMSGAELRHRRFEIVGNFARVSS